MSDIEKDEYESDGCVFNYAHKRLGKSRIISKEEIIKIDPHKSNTDSMFVKCGACEVYMDFTSGPTNALDGWWICPECGIKVNESTAYNQLERENEEYLTRIDLTEDDRDEVCKFCGGAWPNCKTSCKLFD